MFLPLGSPCKTSGTPRFVRGRGANTLSGSNTCVMHVLYTIGTDAMLMNYTMYRCNTRSASRSVFIIIHILRTETWELWRSTSQFLLTRGERHCSLQSSHNHSNGNQHLYITKKGDFSRFRNFSPNSKKIGHRNVINDRASRTSTSTSVARHAIFCARV